MLTALMLYTDCFHWNDLSGMSMSELRYVRPNEYVTDFRTPITGITPATFYREGVISEDEAGHFWRLVTSLLCNSLHLVHHSFADVLFREGHVGVLFCSILEFGSGLFVSHNVSEKGQQLIKQKGRYPCRYQRHKSSTWLIKVWLGNFVLATMVWKKAFAVVLYQAGFECQSRP